MSAGLSRCVYLCALNIQEHSVSEFGEVDCPGLQVTAAPAGGEDRPWFRYATFKERAPTGAHSLSVAVLVALLASVDMLRMRAPPAGRKRTLLTAVQVE